MSWGVELWDHVDVISSHTQKGLDFCERMSNFFKDRCLIENEYSTKIKRLVKTYQGKSGKTEEPLFSYEKAFLLYLSEVKDASGQREVVSENTGVRIQRDLQQLITDLKQTRRKYLQDASRQETTFQAQLNELDRVKKQYEKAWKDWERATETHEKNEADIHLSRADVEKSRVNMLHKSKQCDQSKIDYASVLQTTNAVQREHYNVIMPQIFRNLQSLEEQRVDRVKELLRISADIESAVVPITNTCITGMMNASLSIDSLQDSKLLIDLNKTGFTPPEDIPFQEQMSAPLTPSNGLTSSSPRGTLRSTFRSSTRGDASRASSRTRKKRGRILSLFGTPKNEEEKEDFSHLPPIQQKKKLKSKIDSLQTSLNKLSAERTGMMKMQEAYRSNPKLGDAASLSLQLTENSAACQELLKDINKYESYMHKLDSGGGMTRSGSLSTSESNVSLSTSLQQLSLPSQPHLTTTPSTPTATMCSSSSVLQRLEPERLEPERLEPEDQNGGDDDFDDSAIIRHSSSKHSGDRVLPTRGPSDARRSGMSRVGSGGRMSGMSRRSDELEGMRGSHLDDSFDDVEEGSAGDVFQPIGTCVALYAFDATSEGSISMRYGEEFELLEKDAGDGWTRVRRERGGEEGFVPTSYIQCRTQTCV